MSTRKEEFAAAAVTGLTSGAGQGVVRPEQIAKQAFEIATALESIFLAAEGAAPGSQQVVVQLHTAPIPQASIAPFQHGQGGGGGQPPPPMMGSTVQGGPPNVAGFPPLSTMVAPAPTAAAGAQGGVVDWEDPSDPMALSNREARHWRRLIPSLPARPPSYDETPQAMNVRKMRLFMISNYKSVKPDWPMAYMQHPSQGGVGEPPPEGLNAMAQNPV